MNEYVAEVLDRYDFEHKNGPKVIRDAVYGFQQFEAHEIAIIDSPLVQRLRGVHQTALSHFIYPSANHTRFEHSLGVATKAAQMADALPVSASPSPTERIELRLAALLHDVGHGLFSHLTESIFSEREPELVNEIKSSQEFAQKTNLGEALSALVVRSPAFVSLLDETKSAHTEVKALQDVDAGRVARLILGSASDESTQYLADIISGPFDADKLDYLGRDCHFTGIRAEVDWERITYALDVFEAEGRYRQLAVWDEAVPHLEQILFSKMMMFAAVYHHHKIRTLEAMVRAVFETASANREDINEPLLRFDKITDMWRLSEADFFSLGTREPILGDQVRRILDRRLLHRALAINISTVKREPQNAGRYQQFQKLSAAPRAHHTLRRIANAILAEIPGEHRRPSHDIWLDFPRTPPLSDDAEQCVVLVGDGEKKSLNEFFPTEDWVATYTDQKLTAHLFYGGNLKSRTAAADAGEIVFAELYGLTLTEQARRGLK